MKTNARNVTIKDVAERAGVAISTVSRVLNGLDRVSPETRTKVEKAIEDLGFVRNNIAASMKSGHSKLIAVVVPDIINEYYSAVIRGVEEVASEAGYITTIFSSRESHSREQDFFSGEFGNIIDGAIIIPAYDDLEYYRMVSKPVIIIDRYISGSDMDAVVIDNYEGSYLLTKELLNAGHRKIAIISGELEFNIGRDRLRGYLDAIREAGIPEEKKYIRIDSWYKEHGYKSTIELLDLDDAPTAIVAANNLITIGSISALRERKIEIGKDFSLVGFDDSKVTELIERGITVISRPKEEMGRIGMIKLMDLINGNKNSEYSKKVILGVDLVRRGSVHRI